MERLKAAYKAQGYTGRTFAKAVGLSRPLLSNINQGVVNPTPTTLEKMAAELNCAKQAIITPGEFEYGLAFRNGATKRRDAYKPKLSARLDPHVFLRLETRRAELEMTQSRFIEYLLNIERAGKSSGSVA